MKSSGGSWENGRVTFYDEIGGEPTIRRIVDTFYEGVANDPVLRPMYPEEDLAPAAERLTLFLSQYWGGPSTYNELRGHPRLRIRHAPFKVNEDARDRWLSHFARGLVAVELTEQQRAEFWAYVTHAANFLLNSD